MPRRDIGVHAIKHPPPLLIGVKAQIEEGADIIARLRRTTGNGIADLARRIGVARIIMVGMTQKRDQIARRGKTQPQNQRILAFIRKRIGKFGIKPTPQANPRRIGRAGKRRGATIGKGPIRRLDIFGRSAVSGKPHQSRLGRVK